MSATPHNGEFTKAARAGSARLARIMSLRELRRHPWRTLLIILLIGLPVFSLTFGAVLIASTELTSPETERERILWGADGIIRTDEHLAGNYLPDPRKLETYYHPNDLEYAGMDSAEAEKLLAEAGPAITGSLTEILPENSKGIPVYSAYVDITIDQDIPVFAEAIVADFDSSFLTSPDGRFRVLEGTLDLNVADAETTQKVAASPALLQEIQIQRHRLAETGQASSNREDTRVVMQSGNDYPIEFDGTVLDRSGSWITAFDIFTLNQSSASTPQVFVPSQSPLGQEIVSGSTIRTVYVLGNTPTDYATLLQYSKGGHQALFTSLAENPPEELSAYFDELDYQVSPAERLVPILMLTVLILAETGLLAGAAFAVGARQQKRNTALLSVSGAEPITVQQTMFYTGVWTGLIATIGGITVGLATVLSWIRVAQAQGIEIPELNIPWVIITAAGCLAFMAAIFSAWLPARKVAQEDAWSAIKGATSERTPPSKTVFVLGVIHALIGVFVMATATVWGMNLQTMRTYFYLITPLSGLLILGALILGVGLMLMIPGLINQLTRALTRMPFSFRMAARDADRNRSRSVPVTISMAGATAVGTLFVMLTATFIGGYNDDSYLPEQEPSLDLSLLYFASAEDLASMKAESEQAGYEFEERWFFTAGPEAALKKLEAAIHQTKSPSVIRNWLVSYPTGSCEVDGGTDCTELLPLLEPDSECTLPIPTAEGLNARIAELQDEQLNRTRTLARECSNPQMNSGLFIYDTGLIVADPADESTIPTVLWGDDPEITEAFKSGKALVFDHNYLDTSLDQNGVGTLHLGEFSRDPATLLDMSDEEVAEFFGIYDEHISTNLSYSALQEGNFLWEPESKVRLPAIVIEPHTNPMATAVIPSHALDGTNQVERQNYLLLQFEEDLQEENVLALDKELHLDNLFLQWSGYDDGSNLTRWLFTGIIALLVITVAGITTGLSLADSRKDQIILASIGAPPTTRKTLAAVQALLASSIGVLLGVLIGTLPAVGLGLITVASLDWLPWLQLLALLIGLPILTALLTWLIVPLKMPLMQRF